MLYIKFYKDLLMKAYSIYFFSHKLPRIWQKMELYSITEVLFLFHTTKKALRNND